MPSKVAEYQVRKWQRCLTWMKTQGQTLAGVLDGDIPFSTDIQRFLSTDGLTLVVECASPVAVRAHAKDALFGEKRLDRHEHWSPSG